MFPIRFILLCVISFLLATSAKSDFAAEDDGAKLRLTVGEKAVEVFDADGRQLASLPYVGKRDEEDDGLPYATAGDMNFDGFPDVRVLYSKGMVNTYYDCWLWSPETTSFVLREDMRLLSNPVFDAKAGRVYVHERNSAVSFMQGSLAWDKDRLIWIEKMVWDKTEDGADMVCRHYVGGEDGVLRVTGETVHDAEDDGFAPEAGPENDSAFNISNLLGEGIAALLVRYSSLDGETRYASSRIFLPSQENHDIAVREMMLPERIILELTTKVIDFNDISALKPTRHMYVAADREKGRPVLRRFDSEDAVAVEGIEYDFSDASARSRAIDPTPLIDAASWKEIDSLANSVLFKEAQGWGKTAYFPSLWKKRYGVAKVQAVNRLNPDEGISVTIRVRPADAKDVADIFDALFACFMEEGRRPLSFSMHIQTNEDPDPRTDIELDFRRGDADEWEKKALMRERLATAYKDRSLREATMLWVEKDARDEARAGKESAAGRGVVITICPGIMEAVFLPDGRMLMR